MKSFLNDHNQHMMVSSRSRAGACGENALHAQIEFMVFLLLFDFKFIKQCQNPSSSYVFSNRLFCFLAKEIWVIVVSYFAGETHNWWWDRVLCWKPFKDITGAEGMYSWFLLLQIQYDLDLHFGTSFNIPKFMKLYEVFKNSSYLHERDVKKKCLEQQV